MQGNEDLLKVFLQYLQRCCSRGSPETAEHLLGHELKHLLNASTVVRPEVRHGALSAVYAAMTAAVQCDEVCLHAVLGFAPRCVQKSSMDAHLDVHTHTVLRSGLAAPQGGSCLVLALCFAALPGALPK